MSLTRWALRTPSRAWRLSVEEWIRIRALISAALCHPAARLCWARLGIWYAWRILHTAKPVKRCPVPVRNQRALKASRQSDHRFERWQERVTVRPQSPRFDADTGRQAEVGVPVTWSRRPSIGCGGEDDLVSDQGYIFDEQAQNPFTFASWCAVVVPDFWQVGDQRLDALSGCWAQVGIFRLHGTCIFFLGLGKLGEFFRSSAVPDCPPPDGFPAGPAGIGVAPVPPPREHAGPGRDAAMDLRSARAQFLEDFERYLE